MAPILELCPAFLFGNETLLPGVLFLFSSQGHPKCNNSAGFQVKLQSRNTYFDAKQEGALRPPKKGKPPQLKKEGLQFILEALALISRELNFPGPSETASHFRGNGIARWLSDELKCVSDELKCFSDETRWRYVLGIGEKMADGQQ